MPSTQSELAEFNVLILPLGPLCPEVSLTPSGRPAGAHAG